MFLSYNYDSLVYIFLKEAQGMAKYTNTIEYKLKTTVDLGGVNQLKNILLGLL